MPLRFVGTSRYDDINSDRRAGISGAQYPIGCLDDQVELHFVHYQSEAEALAKWTRRVDRIAWDTDSLYVRFCTRDLPTTEHLAAFDCLHFKHKVCFVGKPIPGMRSAVCIPSADGTLRVQARLDLSLFRNPFFDVADWLNGGSGRPRGLYWIMTRGTRFPGRQMD
jgi:uncharacterized protein (DUF1919 family)